MKELLILLFGNKITKLSSNSANIISIFTNTINDLVNINEQIDSEIDSKTEVIATLTQEVQTLDDLKISNDKIISKVKQIIE